MTMTRQITLGEFPHFLCSIYDTLTEIKDPEQQRIILNQFLNEIIRIERPRDNWQSSGGVSDIKLPSAESNQFEITFSYITNKYHTHISGSFIFSQQKSIMTHNEGRFAKGRTIQNGATVKLIQSNEEVKPPTPMTEYDMGWGYYNIGTIPALANPFLAKLPPQTKAPVDPTVEFCSTLFNAIKKEDPQTQQQIKEVIENKIIACLKSRNEKDKLTIDIKPIPITGDKIVITIIDAGLSIVQEPTSTYTFTFSDQRAVISHQYTKEYGGEGYESEDHTTTVTVENDGVRGEGYDCRGDRAITPAAKLQQMMNYIESYKLRTILSQPANAPLPPAETKQSAQQPLPSAPPAETAALSAIPRSISQDEYPQFLCSIYNTITSADEQTRQAILTQIKDNIRSRYLGDSYLKTTIDRVDFTDPVTIKDNKVIIKYHVLFKDNKSYDSSFEFGENETIVKEKINGDTYFNAMITATNKAMTGSVLNLNNTRGRQYDPYEIKQFFSSFKMHEIPVLANNITTKTARTELEKKNDLERLAKKDYIQFVGSIFETIRSSNSVTQQIILKKIKENILSYYKDWFFSPRAAKVDFEPDTTIITSDKVIIKYKVKIGKDTSQVYSFEFGKHSAIIKVTSEIPKFPKQTRIVTVINSEISAEKIDGPNSERGVGSITLQGRNDSDDLEEFFADFKMDMIPELRGVATSLEQAPSLSSAPSAETKQSAQVLQQQVVPSAPQLQAATTPTTSSSATYSHAQSQSRSADMTIRTHKGNIEFCISLFGIVNNDAYLQENIIKAIKDGIIAIVPENRLKLHSCEIRSNGEIFIDFSHDQTDEDGSWDNRYSFTFSDQKAVMSDAYHAGYYPKGTADTTTLTIVKDSVKWGGEGRLLQTPDSLLQDLMKYIDTPNVRSLLSKTALALPSAPHIETKQSAQVLQQQVVPSAPKLQAAPTPAASSSATSSHVQPQSGTSSTIKEKIQFCNSLFDSIQREIKENGKNREEIQMAIQNSIHPSKFYGVPNCFIDNEKIKITFDDTVNGYSLQFDNQNIFLHKYSLGRGDLSDRSFTLEKDGSVKGGKQEDLEDFMRFIEPSTLRSALSSPAAASSASQPVAFSASPQHYNFAPQADYQASSQVPSAPPPPAPLPSAPPLAVPPSSMASLHQSFAPSEPPPQYEPPTDDYEVKKGSGRIPFAPPPSAPPPSYFTNNRFDKRRDQQYDQNAVFGEYGDYYKTREQIEANPFFNTGERKGDGYERYKGIDCINLSAAQKKPGWFSRRFNSYTKVHIKDNELGLITHNNKQEIVKPGIYYFKNSTTQLNNKVEAHAPLIQHGKLKIMTVPRGHMAHAVNTAEPNSRFKLLGPGRYTFDTNARVSKVINPYGLEVSLEDGSKIFTRVPEGKSGFGEVKGLDEAFVYRPGVHLIDPGIEFKDRVSTKVQCVLLKKVSIQLADNTVVTADATVSYQIPDDADLEGKMYQDNQLLTSSVQKVVQYAGSDEDKIKDAIEKGKDQKPGLAEQKVKDVCRTMDFPSLITKGNKIIITKPETNLNVSNDLAYKGVKFLSVSFNNIIPDQDYSDLLTEDAIRRIKAESEAELKELAREESTSYQVIRKNAQQDLLQPSASEIQELKQQLQSSTAMSAPSVSEPRVFRLDQKFVDEKNQGHQRRPRQQLTLPSKNITLSPTASADYFEEKTPRKRQGANYEDYANDMRIPCVTQSYLNSFLGWSSWLLPNFMTGNQSIEVKANEIGLIRINGKPEFLKPGKYTLHSSIEWVRSEKIKSEHGEKVIVKHDSVTIANITSDKDRLYVEDNTLCDERGNVKSYALLGAGIHVIDSSTMTYRELVPCENAIIVKKTEDELERTKATKWQFFASALAPGKKPEKRQVFLYETKDGIAYTVRTPKGDRVDGVIPRNELQAPDPFTPESLHKLEKEILEKIAKAKHIRYTPEQDPGNKVLFVTIAPNDAGIFYDETGELGVCGSGEFQIEDKWTFYSKFPLQGEKQISVEAYTADKIRVKVQTTVSYEIPIEQLYLAIREFGINKIENEIERLATEKVIGEIQKLSYISNAKVSKEAQKDAKDIQPSFSEFAQQANRNALAGLADLKQSGIEITGVSIADQIIPTDPQITKAMQDRLRLRRAREFAIRDQAIQEKTVQDQLQAQAREIVGLRIQVAEKDRRRQDATSAGQLTAQGFHKQGMPDSSGNSGGTGLQPPRYDQR